MSLNLIFIKVSPVFGKNFEISSNSLRDFKLKSLKELDEISKFLPKTGDTLIKLQLSDKINSLNFQLKNKRNIDRKTINLLRNKHISAIIG